MIEIRRASPNDMADIVDFQLAMALETENLVLHRDTVEKGVAYVFSHPQVGNYWLACTADQVLGCLLVLFEWSDWRNGNVVWIHSVYVKQEYRGSRIFRKMYQHINQWVEETDDLRGIRLYVDKTNVSAQAVYRKMGMNAEHYDLYEWMKPI